jgi:hypothetical protein
MPSVYNLVKYNGSEELLKGAALVSTNEVEQLEWQQRGEVSSRLQDSSRL